MIKKAGVIGAGMMGSEIALCFAKSGIEVIMSDISIEFAEKGKQNQEKILNKEIAKGRLTEEKKEAILSKVIITDDIAIMRDCDFIVEAASENVDIKCGLYKKLDEVCKKETVISTNTSSLSVTKLAACLPKSRQEKFIGTHFFSPATKMKLVEVVPGLRTVDKTVEIAKTMVTAIEHEYIVAKDVCGFVVNRMLNIFFIEGIRLVEEGVATPSDIDKACKLALGHPVGPFELLDLTSNDLNLYVHNTFFNEYGERYRPRPLLKKMVAAGKCGRKTGEGWYQYDNSEK